MNKSFIYLSSISLLFFYSSVNAQSNMQQKDSTKKIIKSDSHTYRYKDSTDHKDKDSFELPKSHGLPAGSRHHDPVKPVRTKSPSSLKADRKKEFEVYRQ